MTAFETQLFEDFVKKMGEIETSIEGLYVLKEGRPVFEHRWAFDRVRNIYSHTKSFIVTALGIALDDGVISLDDRLAAYFPESVPEDADPKVHDIRLRDLLTMSSGFGIPLLMGEQRQKGQGFPDYLKFMLSQPVRDIPGSRFVYSSADTYLISRMVEKAVGQNMLEYLYARLLKPMGIPLPTMSCCPKGHPFGGGGMFLRLSDQAKLGQLYLDGGLWQGQRLVSESWTKECGTKHIDIIIPKEMITGDFAQSEWHRAYGYQFWMCEPGTKSFRADGAHGQLTVILPEKQMVVSVQHSEEKRDRGMQDELRQLVHILYQ